MPTEQLIQFVLLAATGLLFAAGFALGFMHIRRLGREAQAEGGGLPHEASMGVPARAAWIAGMCAGAGLLAWRAAAVGSLTPAVSNPFDAFLLLALLLSLIVMYFRWTRHLRSLTFFMQPMIVVLLAMGLALALIHGDRGEPQNFLPAWTFIHVMTIIIATLSLSLACVGAGVYLLADRQLRRKGLDSSHRWVGLPPLASIERFNRWMIYGGFPMLTLASVAGFLQQAHQTSGSAAQHVKIALGLLSWLVYAALLHVPLNPRFRGRRAAWLSIIGFVLFIGAFAAAKWSG